MKRGFSKKLLYYVILLGLLIGYASVIRYFSKPEFFSGHWQITAGSQFYKNLVLIVFVVTAAVLYLKFPSFNRLYFTAVSALVLGIWLKVVPGMGETVRFLLALGGGNLLLLAGPALILLVSILFGRVYCGYVCPAGAVFELIGKIGPGFRPGKKVYVILRNLKYVTLLLSLTLISACYFEITDMEPFSLFTVIYAPTAGVWVTLSVFLLSSFLSGRVWCIYLCPVGALLGLCSAKCIFPKEKMCKGCDILKSGDRFDAECLRCQRQEKAT